MLLTTKLKFHDIGGGEEIFASSDGHLEINAWTTLDVTAPIIDLNASTRVDVSGTLTVGGDLIVNGTTTTVNSTIVTIDDPVFTLGGDTPPASETTKDKGIEFRYHTGSAAKRGFFGWDDDASSFTFIADATNNSEVFSGTAGNAIFTNITGTLQTAAQGNVTSLGTLTTLTVDNVIINGTTIGHTSDTDLMTLSSGALTIAGALKLGNNTLVSPNAVADDLVIDPGVASVGLSILSSGQGAVNFGDAGNNDAGAITYVHSSDSLILTSNATNVLTFNNEATYSAITVLPCPQPNDNNPPPSFFIFCIICSMITIW